MITIVLPVISLEIGLSRGGCAGGMTILGVLLLIRCLPWVHGTTLVAPWAWATLALVFVGSVECLAGFNGWDEGSHRLQALQLIAAASTFCPGVAILGAKRPQCHVWQFVVVSLWGILALPAAESLVLGQGGQLRVDAFRSWFMLALLVLCMANGLPTRFGVSAALCGFAQLILLAKHLPLLRSALAINSEFISLILVVLALGLVVAGVPRKHRVSDAVDRVWLDFRDSFGMLWGLRLAERLNAISAQSGWGLSLRWRGIHVGTNLTSASEISPEIVRELRKNLHALLLRFVSPDWIAARTGESVD